jgi:hypothetical protein
VKLALPPAKDLIIGGLLAALLALAGWHVASTRPPKPPDPSAGLAALGRHYAPSLARAYAAGWDAAADAIAGNKTVAEAQAALQATFAAERARSIAEVTPALAAVLAEGAEPKDAADRIRVASAWRAFASGLKGGR